MGIFLWNPRLDRLPDQIKEPRKFEDEGIFKPHGIIIYADVDEKLDIF